MVEVGRRCCAEINSALVNFARSKELRRRRAHVESIESIESVESVNDELALDGNLLFRC